jgi:hypothetical protein
MNKYGKNLFYCVGILIFILSGCNKSNDETTSSEVKISIIEKNLDVKKINLSNETENLEKLIYSACKLSMFLSSQVISETKYSKIPQLFNYKGSHFDQKYKENEKNEKILITRSSMHFNNKPIDFPDDFSSDIKIPKNTFVDLIKNIDSLNSDWNELNFSLVEEKVKDGSKNIKYSFKAVVIKSEKIIICETRNRYLEP